MTINRKVRFVQALFGSIILTIMMQPISMFGYGAYIWMLFMPLLLFFAFGADFKIIPSMIASYVCGILWALANGILAGAMGGILSAEIVNILAPIIIIFFILTVHENFLAKTIVGNIPALFMGLASTFFIFLIVPANAPTITPLHLIGLFLYGILLSIILVSGGFAICSLIFGKETTIMVFQGKEDK